MIVVATDEEYALAKKRFKGHKIVKTGVGGTNVIEKLRKYPKWTKIINFGYVGSNNIPIGTEVNVSISYLYHKNVDFEESIYHLKHKNYTNDVICLTSNDFVTHTKIKEPVVFDMELAYICALGFKNIKSIKIVSDNLSLKQYEQKVGD